MEPQPAVWMLNSSAYAKVDHTLYLVNQEDKDLIQEHWNEGEEDKSPGLTVSRNAAPNTPVAYLVRNGDNAHHLVIYLSNEGGKVTVAASRLDTKTPSFVHQDLPKVFRSHVNKNITQNMRLSGHFVSNGALVIFQDEKNILHGYLLQANHEPNDYDAKELWLVDCTTNASLVAKGPHILLVHEKVIELNYWDGVHIRRMISDLTLLSSWKSEDQFSKAFKWPVEKFLILFNGNNDVHMLVLRNEAKKQIWWDRTKDEPEEPFLIGTIENGLFNHASKQQNAAETVARMINKTLAMI